MGKAALAVRSFFGKNVALESVFALDLTSARELESLLGAGFGLHLRHGTDLLFELLFLFCWSDQDKHPLSFKVGQGLHFAEVGDVLS